MELDELIFLGACSLYESMLKRYVIGQDVKQLAVARAKEIWKEVLRQNRLD